MGKSSKSGKFKSGKIHLMIPQANWERIDAHLRSYNESGERVTPKIKLAHVVNQALVQYLTVRRV